VIYLNYSKYVPLKFTSVFLNGFAVAYLLIVLKHCTTKHWGRNWGKSSC